MMRTRLAGEWRAGFSRPIDERQALASTWGFYISRSWVGQDGGTARLRRKSWRAGFSPREALASLPASGTEVPRGLKSALQNLSVGTNFRRAVPSRRGQALVEFAISALIALLLIFGAVEFSRIMLVYTTLADAARLGARYAITHGTIPGSTGATDPTAGVKAVVQKFLAPGTVNINAAVISTSFPDGTTKPGNRVQVNVSYPYNLLISYLPINVTLSTTSEGIFTW
ncbi:MAG TPA: TadE/TadG family type IV pilus assembly protein [Bryobacteraceae bacterium]